MAKSFKALDSRIKWKMENGKWKMENGKWKMENGKWKMENGKLKDKVSNLGLDELWIVMICTF